MLTTEDYRLLDIIDNFSNQPNKRPCIEIEDVAKRAKDEHGIKMGQSLVLLKLLEKAGALYLDGECVVMKRKKAI